MKVIFLRVISIGLCLQMMISPVMAHAQTSVRRGEEGRTGKAGSFYLKQITSLANLFVASRIPLSCPSALKQPSVSIYFATSVAGFVMELKASKSYTNLQNKKKKDLEIMREKLDQQKANGMIQKATLEMILAQEEEFRDYMHVKKNIATIVTTGYAVATAVAIIEAVLNKIPYIQYDDTVSCTSFSSSNKLVNALLPMVVLGAWGMLDKTEGGIANYGKMAMGLASLLTGASEVMNKILEKMLKNGITRGIYFGSMATLNGVIAGEMAGKYKLAQKNVDLLKDYIGKFKAATLDVHGMAIDEQNDPQILNAQFDPNESAIAMLAKVPDKDLCFGNEKGALLVSESSQCKSLNLTKPKLDGAFNIPLLQQATGHIYNAATSSINGNMRGALLAGNELGNMAGKIKEFRKDAESKLNIRLKEKGEKPLDFEKLANDQMNQLLNQVQGQASAQGVDMASLDKSQLSPLESNKNFEEILKDKKVAAPEVSQPSFDFISSEDNTSLEASTAMAPEESMDNFEVSENDISKEKEASIFKGITHRYFLKYQQFFKIKK